jgi:4-hydroxybenzoate polyprenyltransferase
MNRALDNAKSPPVRQQFKGIVQLTRWKETVPFVVPLSVAGALLAVNAAHSQVDWRLIAVMIANVLAVTYAFMINDIEDAPDDALDPERAQRNPITTGLLNRRLGYNACLVTAVVTLALYATGGWYVFIIGVITLLLSHLYSWKPVRLKAYPVTDVVSHSLMLSGLLMLAGYFIYHSAPGDVWLVAAGATMFSVYGQLYNQVRDYDMDVAAGLKNTTILLGKTNTMRAIYTTVIIAISCIVVAILRGVFPFWLLLALLVAFGVGSLVNPSSDPRGKVVEGGGSKMQSRGLVMFNSFVAIWFAVTLVQQLLIAF